MNNVGRTLIALGMLKSAMMRGRIAQQAMAKSPALMQSVMRSPTNAGRWASRFSAVPQADIQTALTTRPMKPTGMLTPSPNYVLRQYLAKALWKNRGLRFQTPTQNPTPFAPRAPLAPLAQPAEMLV